MAGMVAGVLMVGVLIVLILGAFMLAIHAFRGAASFLPKRDYRLFLRSVNSLNLSPAVETQSQRVAD